jgi:hypothetical protein
VALWPPTGTLCSTEPNACLIGMEELVRVLLQQTGRAEEANPSCGNVIGRNLERSEHPSAIEERPSDVSDTFNADAVCKASKMGRWRLIKGTNEVGSLV